MKNSLESFLNELTDWNRHSERVVVEAIMTGDEELITGACEVLLQHQKDGYLTSDNSKKRSEIIEEINNTTTRYKLGE